MSETKIPFYWIDAFTKEPLKGNPCAVFLNARSMNEKLMQKIAYEMNLSETAFLIPSTKSDFKARYFTPEREIPLAGHPTIALFRALMEEGIISKKEKRAYTLELPAGVIEITIEGELITMQQVKPWFKKVDGNADVLAAYALKRTDVVDQDFYISSTGTPFIMIQLKDRNALANLDVSKFDDRKLLENEKSFGSHFFVLEERDGMLETYSRNFGSYPKYIEDPFTGSATGAMGAYLSQFGKLKTLKNFKAFQGEYLQREGEALVYIEGDIVKISGHGRCILKGEWVCSLN